MAHLTFLLLVLWAGVTVSTVVDLQKRLYGGTDCNQNERKYHVSLTMYSDGRCSHCGGSLIKDQWVLTAAHCRSRPMYAVVGVHAGQQNIQKIEETGMILHPQDDIMLLKLPHPITNIQPVRYCPNTNEDPKIRETVQVAGHGTYKYENGFLIRDLPSNLKCGEMDVEQCDDACWDNYFVTNPYKVPQLHRMCIKNTHVDIRPGDSGGGVIYKGNLYGVIKAGDDVPCQYESLCLRVCPYKNWINQNAV